MATKCPDSRVCAAHAGGGPCSTASRQVAPGWRCGRPTGAWVRRSCQGRRVARASTGPARCVALAVQDRQPLRLVRHWPVGPAVRAAVPMAGEGPAVGGRWVRGRGMARFALQGHRLRACRPGAGDGEPPREFVAGGDHRSGRLLPGPGHLPGRPDPRAPPPRHLRSSCSVPAQVSPVTRPVPGWPSCKAAAR